MFAGARQESASLARLGQQFPATVRTVPLDVRSVDSVRAAAQTVGSASDALDLLINNAAIGSTRATNQLETTDFEQALAIYDVNALGPLRVIQAFADLLRRGSDPCLVNISSEAGSIERCRRQGEFAYCMSKAALNMQTKLLDNLLGSSGVRCIAVHPGWVRTDMGGPNAHLGSEESARRVLAIVSAEQRSGETLYFDSDGSALPW